MKNKKNTVLVCCTILSLLIIVNLTACSTPDYIGDSDYAIVNSGENSYMVMKDIGQYAFSNPDHCVLISENITFATMKEFVETVTEGKLSDSNKLIIANAFPKDGDKVLTCDFNNMYEPVMPSGCTVPEVHWSGQRYSFTLLCNGGSWGILKSLPKQGYNAVYLDRYENLVQTMDLTVYESQQIGEKLIFRVITSTSDIRFERYILKDGNKKFTIQKEFIEYSSVGNASKTVPLRIEMYCEEGDNHYIINLFDLTEDPTDEWLLSFGMQKYVGSDHQEK